MIAIPCSRLYSTNIEKIDSQHKKLINYINILSSAIDEQVETETTKEVFGRLVKNISDHVSTEETLMLIYGYSGYDSNYNLHQQLMLKIDACNVGIESDTIKISTEMINFFREWLLNHISHHEEIMSRRPVGKIA